MDTQTGAAGTPPMGWNSWDCYAATVTEEQLLQNAEYMRKNLLSCGWEYVICDVAWYDPLAGTEKTEYRAFGDFCMDDCSRFIPAENRFPSSAGGRGFGPLAEKIHGMGLKFGLHLMRGIPRQAAHSHCPVKGSGGTADKIADPFSISKWNPDMYGVDPAKPGAQDYYDSVLALYASWGIDFLKVDDICNTNMYPHAPYSAKAEIEMIRRAIDRSGRPMVLSLSPGPALIEEAWHLKANADMWRITDDFWDRWDLLKDMFRRCEIWQSHAGPSSWPDCDMLPLGRIGTGFRKSRDTNFTRDEQRVMMTLWCVFRSPLMMGGDLVSCDAWTRSLLTNTEVLAAHRLGSGPRQLFRDTDEAAWTSAMPDGSFNLALFNLSGENRVVRCPLAAPWPQKLTVRDLWEKKDLAPARGEIAAAIPPHGAVMYRLALLP